MSAMTYAVSDTATLTGRMLKHNIRSIDRIMTVLITPIMLMLAFVFVVGGAISELPGNGLPAGTYALTCLQGTSAGALVAIYVASLVNVSN